MACNRSKDAMGMVEFCLKHSENNGKDFDKNMNMFLFMTLFLLSEDKEKERILTRMHADDNGLYLLEYTLKSVLNRNDLVKELKKNEDLGIIIDSMEDKEKHLEEYLKGLA